MLRESETGHVQFSTAAVTHVHVSLTRCAHFMLKDRLLSVLKASRAYHMFRLRSFYITFRDVSKDTAPNLPQFVSLFLCFPRLQCIYLSFKATYLLGQCSPLFLRSEGAVVRVD
jgi:hypothetical protein